MLRLHRKPPKKLKKKHLLRKTHLAAAEEEQARKRKQENELKKVEKRIEELETRDKEIDDTLVLPDVCTNIGRCAELSREKDKIQQNLKNYMKMGGTCVTAIFSPNITGATVSQLIQWLFCAYIKSFFPEIL